MFSRTRTYNPGTLSFRLSQRAESQEASLPKQITPTSSAWSQLCFPHAPCLQSQRADSFPLHIRSSSQIGPEPAPNFAEPEKLTALPHPSCLQITEAWSLLKLSSHTVPHFPWNFTSTLPKHRWALVFTNFISKSDPSREKTKVK